MGRDSGGFSDERPEHNVYLSAFWIDMTEVTNAMYRKCVDAGACTLPSDISRYKHDYMAGHPVVHITSEQARTYCDWSNKRLPTEAEWEKAARGVDGRNFPWGNTYASTSHLSF